MFSTQQKVSECVSFILLLFNSSTKRDGFTAPDRCVEKVGQIDTQGITEIKVPTSSKVFSVSEAEEPGGEIFGISEGEEGDAGHEEEAQQPCVDEQTLPEHFPGGHFGHRHQL